MTQKVEFNRIVEGMPALIGQVGGANDNPSPGARRPRLVSRSTPSTMITPTRSARDLRSQLDRRLDQVDEATRISFWWRVQEAFEVETDFLTAGQLRLVLSHFRDFAGGSALVRVDHL